MALIYKGIKCAICGREIDIDLKGSYVATRHFIWDQSDPLWRFSDAAMHYECFQAWSLREEFVQKYNSTIGQMIYRDGTRHLMHADGRVETVPAGR